MKIDPSGYNINPKAKAALIGAACRLPGARNEQDFWSLLKNGRCTVGPLPQGRWRPERYLHPRMTEPGFSYSFAGGYLDDPFSFDPSVFGISPREARQIDPQQRLLMEVVWEALEDAGLKPSSLAGQDVGVYVGASSLDYGNLHMTDPASIESHFMTGNTLSIVSNRLSYIFDWRGPSFTVDTACSSSLVAFSQAIDAVDSGQIDMAVVAGVNLLLSPGSFIGFSRASMLSPTGLCRPFSAQGDGYVRAEGAVAFVIMRADSAKARQLTPRAIVLGNGVNSDGRTSGISLPSAAGQKALLDRVYGEIKLDPARLAFVEAHGTGTRVGDPAEAQAIGEALGQKRQNALPIGSVKSNIGHLEPASGLAGAFKAILAMEHRLLPRTLHLDQRNPLIDFDQLNVETAQDNLELAGPQTILHCGVSSFGFGGTNAHVVMREPEKAELPSIRNDSKVAPEFLILSAQTKEALAAQADHYADVLSTKENSLASIASALAYRKERLAHRLAIPLRQGQDVPALLKEFAAAKTPRALAAGIAPSSAPIIAFAYAGNGSQWVGMGRAALAQNANFRKRLKEIDALFAHLSGWSLIEALNDPELETRLGLTSVAQPLLFAIQSAMTSVLADYGLQPSIVFGHSVGEVAAAAAAGALSLQDAVRLIFQRSEQQERVRGAGKMAATNSNAGDTQNLLNELGLKQVSIAAENSATSVTLSGPAEQLEQIAKAGRKRRIAVRMLDLDYPFHNEALDPLHDDLVQALDGLKPRSSEITFVSSVTGDVLDGASLDSEYWWRNVREPVRFHAAMTSAIQLGATLLIEISPRPILRSNINDTLREAGVKGDYLPTFDEKELNEALDPIEVIVARALVHGAKLDEARLFGKPLIGRLPLPAYPWQHKLYNLVETNEALDLYGAVPRHPLIGARLTQGSPEWRTLLDTDCVPYLADHKVDGEVVVPGAALAEMLLAVAREIFPTGPIGIEDFDILSPLVLLRETMREISVRYNNDTHVTDVWSRQRLAGDEWTLHARGRIIEALPDPDPLIVPAGRPFDGATAEDVYARASETGLNYGPSFRLVRSMRYNDQIIQAEFGTADLPMGAFTRQHILSPAGLDAAFHPLFQVMEDKPGVKRTYLPVRFARLRVFKDNAEITRCLLVLDHSTDASIKIDLALYDADGEIVAMLNGGLFRSVILSRHSTDQLYFHVERNCLERLDRMFDARTLASAALTKMSERERPDSWLLLQAFGRSLAHKIIANRLAQQSASVAELIEKGLVAASMQPLLHSLLLCLEQAGLASHGSANQDQDVWRIEPRSGLPDPALILATFAAEFPSASVELVLASKILAHLDESLRSGKAPAYRAQLLEQFETSTLFYAPLLERAAEVIDAIAATMKPDPVKVLVFEPGCLAVIRMLRPYMVDHRVKVTIAGTDRKHLDYLAARIGPDSGIELLELNKDTSSGPSFNLALALSTDKLFNGDMDFGHAISARLVPNGAFVVMQPPIDFIFDLLLGLTEDWYARIIDPAFPIGRIPDSEDTRRALVSAGFREIQSIDAGDGLGSILVASPVLTAKTDVTEHPPLIIGAEGTSAEDPILTQLTQRLRASGRSVRLAPPPEAQLPRKALWAQLVSADNRMKRVDVIELSSLDHGKDDETRLATRISEIVACLEAARASAHHVRLWIVVRGLNDPSGTDPLAEAIWSFARVAMNEYPDVEIRLIAASVELSPTLLADRLTLLLDEPSTEHELLINSAGLWAHRVQRGPDPDKDRSQLAEAALLELPTKGALSQFIWSGTQRKAPGPHEVEVEVVASGLNFRDVMMSMGLLDDDVLDAGLAGAVLGFECAGRVVRVGELVSDLQPGARVMGFAAKAFATHVTADRRVFVPVPARLPLEAAATVPVAFLTAWYSLLEVARLKRGEWVLIHGAAGGVGLAAMQIARWKGAKIVATVGSPDKRALVQMFGADKIFDSRSLSFAEDIKREIGAVDVVLNSLYGEAMLASIKCLKPFGRFVELGKRDYVENTFMGLRAFRRNLSYFGVDVDQLLAANPALTEALMRDLERAFEDGHLTPLPYRIFDAEDVPSAFRLMQSAGHVGKILVKPPSQPLPLPRSEQKFKPGSGVHLIVGGTSGFGFETAAWLAEQGAKTIVIASRSGSLSGALQLRASAISANGTQLIIEKVDATDRLSVQSLIDRVLSRYGRLAGLIHTAMVLEDRLLSGLDAEMIHKVLAPKVTGAQNLDLATRHIKLDYFVLYSSATTLVGSPGQGAYVAANGYLQGLARQRRNIGLPALAVAWGAIADAGVLARDTETAKKLARATGVVGIPARDALNQLGVMLTQHSGEATRYFADITPGGAMRDMKLLSTPAFAPAFGARGPADIGEEVDLMTLIEGLSDIEARTKVAELLALEVGRILRLSAGELDIHRPLTELGMDSLMGLELRMDIEKRFGVELPLVAITSVTNLLDLAGRLISNLRPSQDQGEDSKAPHNVSLDRGMVDRHASETADLENLTPVADAIAEHLQTVKRL